MAIVRKGAHGLLRAEIADVLVHSFAYNYRHYTRCRKMADDVVDFLTARNLLPVVTPHPLPPQDKRQDVEVVLPEDLRKAISMLTERLRKSTLILERESKNGHPRHHKNTVAKNWEAVSQSIDLMEHYLTTLSQVNPPQDAQGEIEATMRVLLQCSVEFVNRPEIEAVMLGPHRLSKTQFLKEARKALTLKGTENGK